MHSRDSVVLLHGLGRSPRSLLAVQWYLQRVGYHVVNVGYPSRRLTVAQAVRRHLEPVLATLPRQDQGRVHFVTHSLGGLLFRAWAAQRAPEFPLGHAVLLAPPNRGSEIIDRLGQQPWVRRLIGPVVDDLTTDPQSLPNRLGPPPESTGVIMGNLALIPLFRSLLGPESDGIVTVEGGRLPGLADFQVTPTDHTFLMWRPQVLRAIEHFLREGRFEPSA